MARYEHLPIYRKTFDLAVYLEQVTHGFSRHHKYGLGTRLQHASGRLIERVVRAQNAEPGWSVPAWNGASPYLNNHGR
jgi:hypothetical protein